MFHWPRLVRQYHWPGLSPQNYLEKEGSSSFFPLISLASFPITTDTFRGFAFNSRKKWWFQPLLIIVSSDSSLRTVFGTSLYDETGSKSKYQGVTPIFFPKGKNHRYRYLMSRLSLQSLLPVMLCIVDSAAIYIMVVKFINTISPLHRSSPFIGGLRCQAILTEHGPYTV
jgi:hypothetical protein